MLRAKNLRRKHIRLLFTSLSILAGLWWLTFDPWHAKGTTADERPHGQDAKAQHPLDDAINKAQIVHDARISRSSAGLHDAARTYRRRRGRHPPPGFEIWHTRALASQAVMVESFFDQIYEDFEPFWGLEPAKIRGALVDWQWTLKIRNGRIKDIPQGRFRSRIWGQMINQVAGDLPDMDIFINPLDEPRLFVPFDKIDSLMRAASKQRDRMMSTPARQISNRFAQWTPVSSSNPPERDWISQSELRPYIFETCPPHSDVPPIGVDRSILTHTTNWTKTKDICVNRHWTDIHGSLMKPATMNISTDLLPIFSAAKLQGSNDILLPPPAYYTDDFLFTGKGWLGDGKTSVPWHKKLHGLVWRGKATGGLVHESTVWKSHRQRLVSMLNASIISCMPDDDLGLQPDLTGVSGQDRTILASWLRTSADASFTDTMCPAEDATKVCQAMSQRFQTAAPISMKKQYYWKYLPDIDGNSLSGRFRAFLTSNSCPMKATIFKEWHDHRLMPWVHFIPLDITLLDLWSTMAYFLGFANTQAHEVEGKKIADEGRSWADKVLRKEDMLLYVHRVLLEYGRVCDDQRDKLGFTDNLFDKRR